MYGALAIYTTNHKEKIDKTKVYQGKRILKKAKFNLQQIRYTTFGKHLLTFFNLNKLTALLLHFINNVNWIAEGLCRGQDIMCHPSLLFMQLLLIIKLKKLKLGIFVVVYIYSKAILPERLLNALKRLVFSRILRCSIKQGATFFAFLLVIQFQNLTVFRAQDTNVVVLIRAFNYFSYHQIFYCLNLVF